MNGTAHPLIGQRVQVSDEYYTGPVVVLEYDPDFLSDEGWPAPFYCHLLDLCDHEMCEGDDDCFGEECRAWYALPEGAQA